MLFIGFTIIYEIVDYLFGFIEPITIFLQSWLQKLYPSKKRTLQNDIILVIGVRHDIAKKLCILCAELKAKLVFWDTNDHGFTKNEMKMITEHTSVYSYKVDIFDHDEVKKATKKLKIDVGNVTILVNMVTPNFFLHVTDELNKFDIAKYFRIVISHYWIMNSFLDHMKEQNAGHIIAVLSSNDVNKDNKTNFISYYSSISAIQGLMKSTKQELRAKTPRNQIKLSTIQNDMDIANSTVKSLPSDDTARIIINVMREEHAMDDTIILKKPRFEAWL